MRYLNIYTVFLATTLMLSCFILLQVIIFLRIKNDTFVNPDLITYLQTLQKGIVTSSILTLESKAEILEIDRKTGYIPRTTIPYAIRMKLSPINDKNNWVYVYFSKNVPIFLPQDTTYKTNKKGTLSELQTGDIIITERIFRYNVVGKYDTQALSTKIIKIDK